MRPVLFIVFAFFITSCAQDNYAKYAPVYNKVTMDEVPDYTNLSNWALGIALPFTMAAFWA